MPRSHSNSGYHPKRKFALHICEETRHTPHLFQCAHIQSSSSGSFQLCCICSSPSIGGTPFIFYKKLIFGSQEFLMKNCYFSAGFLKKLLWYLPKIVDKSNGSVSLEGIRNTKYVHIAFIKERVECIDSFCGCNALLLVPKYQIYPFM